MSEHAKSEHTRYLKKFKLVETDTELPIQGQVRDPHDLYAFLKDLQDEQVPKFVAVYLDDNLLMLGHQVFLGATAETFETQLLYHYYSMFLAKKFMLISNHTSGEVTPTEADVRLMRKLQADSQILSFNPSFDDYIIVSAGKYFSMGTNDGTGCRCGRQMLIDLA